MVSSDTSALNLASASNKASLDAGLRRCTLMGRERDTLAAVKFDLQVEAARHDDQFDSVAFEILHCGCMKPLFPQVPTLPMVKFFDRVSKVGLFCKLVTFVGNIITEEQETAVLELDNELATMRSGTHSTV